MPIKVRCQCGKTLNVPDSAAGKAIKCPGCGKAVSVPSRTVSSSPPGVARSSGSRNEDVSSLFDEEGFSTRVEAVCPACRAEMPAVAVLCTKCGYHKETGTRYEAHKTAGVDIDHGTLALEKAARDMVKERQMQQDLIKGGGLPWWALVMIIVIGGGGLTIATLGVNAANQADESDRPPLWQSLMMLTEATFLFAAAVCLLIGVVRILIHYLGKKQEQTNWRAILKTLALAILFGAAGWGAHVARQPGNGPGADGGGLSPVDEMIRKQQGK